MGNSLQAAGSTPAGCANLLKDDVMGEKLWERLQKMADLLHWLGKYDERDALAMTARLMRANNIETLEEWLSFVESQERARQSTER
jgi:hypothetical protein